MRDLLILYNPYYQSDVIKAHLEVLKAQGQVAFGKVRSKLKDKFGANLNANLGVNLQENSLVGHSNEDLQENLNLQNLSA